jgi:hypothetical protein
VGSWAETTPAACTTAGIETGYCPNCGATVTRAGAAAFGHDYGGWTTTIPATCTDAAEQERICSHDASHIETQTFGSPNTTAHSYGAWKTKTPANCTYAEEQERVCSRDASHIDTQFVGSLNSTAHDWDYSLVTTPPTCTTLGSSGTRTCNICHTSENDTTFPIDPDAHDWGAWVQTGTTLTRTCNRDSSHIETLTDNTEILQTLIEAAPPNSSVNLSDFPDWKLDSAVTVDKEITLTTAPGSTVTLVRQGTTPPIDTPQTAQNAFSIKSGGKLILTAGTGGELIVTAQATVGVPLFNISTGGELVLTAGAKITDPRTATAQNFSAVHINGGRFTMTGGEISNIARHSAVYMTGNTSIFNMSGGIITGCRGTNGSYAGGVTIRGGTFTMSGSAEISGNYSVTTSGYGGGGVIVNGGTFIMQGGTIRNNYTNMNGGGVFVRSGATFTKTGGIIYGMDAGAPDWNRITNNPTPPNAYAGQGYAVYVAGPTVRVRDNTADPSVGLDSGTADNWE